MKVKVENSELVRYKTLPKEKALFVQPPHKALRSHKKEFPNGIRVRYRWETLAREKSSD